VPQLATPSAQLGAVTSVHKAPGFEVIEPLTQVQLADGSQVRPVWQGGSVELQIAPFAGS
jgi:hypothetical protein